MSVFRQQFAMAGHGNRFADFAHQPRGEHVAGLVLALQGPGQAGGDADIGPLGQNALGRYKCVRLSHSRQDHADTSPANFRLKPRQFASNSPEFSPPLPRGKFRFNRKCHQNDHHDRRFSAPHAACARAIAPAPRDAT
jgi:hypothetical protein